MKGFLLFLVVALWSGVKMRNAYRKQMSELESGTASDQSTLNSTFESLFDESRQQAGEEEGADSTFASEAASAGYYSYETSSSATDRKTAANTFRPAQTMRPVRPATVQVQTEADAMAFDLRQAIIYQTILDNKYLSDTQSSIIN